jgi:hypothetical protein
MSPNVIAEYYQTGRDVTMKSPKEMTSSTSQVRNGCQSSQKEEEARALK